MANEYDMRDAVALVASELGDRTFTFNGATYACAGGDVVQSKDLGEGGFSPDNTVTIVCDQSKMPSTPPGEQDVITYQGVGLRIIGVTKAPDSSLYVFECVDDSRGA